MGNIRTSIFRAFQQIGQIAGGMRGLDQVDLGAPLQPVLDLQRLGEIGAGYGNWWGYGSIGIANDHSAATEVFGTWNFYDQAIFNTLQANPNDVWVWLIELNLVQTATLALTSGVAALGQGAITGALTTQVHPIARWNTDLAASTSGGLEIGNYDDGPIYMVNLPKMISPGSTLLFRSTVSAAVASAVCTLFGTVWYGPRGVLPPGLA